MKLSLWTGMALASCLVSLVDSYGFPQKTFTRPLALSEQFQPDAQRLLSTHEHHAEWLNPEELVKKGIRFIDITDHVDLDMKAEATRKRHALLALPREPKNKDKVQSILKQLDTSRMRKRLEKLTSFQNRYYRSETGAQASQWVFDVVNDIVKASGRTRVQVEQFHHSWPQDSIIVRMEPLGPSSGTLPTVIVGSHLDTVRGSFWREGRAPGADDDGSGTVTSLEAFTALMMDKTFEPKEAALEFHWYSGEEAGLRGSQDVAALYQRKERVVKGMMQLDMTGYNNPAKTETIGIVTDYTDPELTELMRGLVQTYSRLNFTNTQCNYGCSDHASWNKAGFRSAFPFEGRFQDSSPYIHSKDDTIDHINFDHAVEFAKVAVGFAVELTH